MRFGTAVAAAGLIALAAVGVGAAPAAPGIMPISQVRAGMTGYGLTVFRGARIERFQVTVVDVVRKGSLVAPGHDMILVRVAGGPLVARGAFAIHGMSGSPIYIGGRLIGAYSQAEPATKEPLAGVTPIEDMLEAWDPKLPQTPVVQVPARTPRSVALAHPLRFGGRRITRIVFDAPRDGRLRPTRSTAVLQRCMSVMPVAGLPARVRERLGKLLEPYDIRVVQAAAGGSMPQMPGTPMVPGAAIGMMLISGDVPMAATGTLTYRQGNRVLAFGHPFMGVGPIDAPLCAAYVHEVWPLQMNSYKLSSPGPMVGASTQDRPFAVAGVLGRVAKTIPVTIEVRDISMGRTRRYVVRVVSHPALTGALVGVATATAIADVRSLAVPAMARVETTVEAEEIGSIKRTNTLYGSTAVDQVATGDLDEIAGMLSGNPFYPLAMKSATVRVEIETGRRTATIQRVFLRESKVAPGDTVEVGVVLKPYRAQPVTQFLRLRVPVNAPAGRTMLEVRGGASGGQGAMAALLARMGATAGGDQSAPVSTAQMVRRFLAREKGTELLARLLVPVTAVSVDGETLTGLPPSIDASMRSSRASSVQFDRDDVRVVQGTDWVVSGRQLLAMTVQRRDARETPSAPVPGGMSTMPPMAPGMSGDPAPVMDGPLLGDLLSAAGAAMPEPGESDAATLVRPPAAGPSPTAKPAAAPAPAAAPPAAAAAPSATEKPVARVSQTWKQASRADFERGEAHGASVASDGTVTVAPILRRIAGTTETFAWAIASGADGAVYVGTGTQARVLAVSPGGAVRTVAQLPETSVHALLALPDGSLIAGTGPRGRTYRIAPDGAFSLIHTAPQKYVLSLARETSGGVLIGTGGGAAALYRWQPGGTVSRLAALPDEHVLSLAVDAAGSVFAGTAPSGLVCRVTPAGAVSVLYDAPEPSVTGVACAAGGSVLACTAPRGLVYRIQPDGSAKAVSDRALPAFTAMAAGPAGAVVAAAGSTVYAIGADDTLRAMDPPGDVDLLSVAVASNGTIYAGGANTADVYAAQPVCAGAVGTVESVAHDARLPARWGALRWDADQPAGSRIEFETRSGNAAQPDASWGPWTAVRPRGPREGSVMSAAARYVQYRVRLTGASAGAPVLRSVALTVRPLNQAPRVTLQAPAAGDVWSGPQTIRWSAVDPEGDPLTSEVQMSGDGGAHWIALPTGKTAPAAPAPLASGGPAAPAVVPARAPAPAHRPSVAQAQAILDRHPDVPPALRDAILKRAMEVNTPPDAPVAPDAPGDASPSPAAGATSRTIDTRVIKDGTYRIRVTASDRQANADDAQAGSALSEPFEVCNAAPVVVIVSAAVRLGADRVAVIPGVAYHRSVAITAVQFRVDAGVWMAASADDGFFDGDLEGFTCRTAPLAVGKHTVEIRAYQSAGVIATERAPVEVK